jgi:glucan biosynthesis protein
VTPIARRARASSTRRDRGNTEDAHRFVIDFAGKRLNALPADAAIRPSFRSHRSLMRARSWISICSRIPLPAGGA